MAGPAPPPDRAKRGGAPAPAAAPAARRASGNPSSSKRQFGRSSAHERTLAAAAGSGSGSGSGSRHGILCKALGEFNQMSSPLFGDNVDETTRNDDYLENLQTIDVFLYVCTCQRRRLTIVFGNVSRNGDRGPQFSIDLHHHFKLITSQCRFICLWPSFIDKRCAVSQMRPQLMSYVWHKRTEQSY